MSSDPAVTSGSTIWLRSFRVHLLFCVEVRRSSSPLIRVIRVIGLKVPESTATSPEIVNDTTDPKTVWFKKRKTLCPVKVRKQFSSVFSIIESFDQSLQLLETFITSIPHFVF